MLNELYCFVIKFKRTIFAYVNNIRGKDTKNINAIQQKKRKYEIRKNHQSD